MVAKAVAIQRLHMAHGRGNSVFAMTFVDAHQERAPVSQFATAVVPALNRAQSRHRHALLAP
jgi:hypothetical protein